MNYFKMTKVIDILFISVVLIILSIPLMSMVSGIEPTIQVTENRALSELPKGLSGLASVFEYPKKFSIYFSDNYGFRNYLCHLHLRLMVDVLKVPVIKEMIIGKGNWMFWGGDHILDRHRTLKPLGIDELSQLKQIHYKICS